MEREERFMRLALQEAEQAMALGEVPVGAVIVRGDEVVSMGHNLRETGKNALAHAEIIAINRHAKLWGAGGCINASFMSLWSPARCVLGRSSTLGFSG